MPTKPPSPNIDEQVIAAAWYRYCADLGRPDVGRDESPHERFRAAAEATLAVLRDIAEHIDDARAIREAQERDTGRRYSLDHVLARSDEAVDEGDPA